MNRTLNICLAATLVVGLSACDRFGGRRGGDNGVTPPAGNTVANAADANASGGKDESAAGGNVSTASAAPFTGEVTRQFLVGRWTDNNDCTSTIEFRADGRFIAPTGEGLWVLDGDQLTFQGASTVSARVQAPDANTIMLIHPDNSVGRSTRCTG